MRAVPFTQNFLKTVAGSNLHLKTMAKVDCTELAPISRHHITGFNTGKEFVCSIEFKNSANIYLHRSVEAGSVQRRTIAARRQMICVFIMKESEPQLAIEGNTPAAPAGFCAE
jgi:hypothetical protein